MTFDATLKVPIYAEKYAICEFFCKILVIYAAISWSLRSRDHYKPVWLFGWVASRQVFLLKFRPTAWVYVTYYSCCCETSICASVVTCIHYTLCCSAMGCTNVLITRKPHPASVSFLTVTATRLLTGKGLKLTSWHEKNSLLHGLHVKPCTKRTNWTEQNWTEFDVEFSSVQYGSVLSLSAHSATPLNRTVNQQVVRVSSTFRTTVWLKKVSCILRWWIYQQSRTIYIAKIKKNKK